MLTHRVGAGIVPVVHGEVFALVPYCPGYAVGDGGTVWSKKTGIWKPLKERVDKDGYHRVNIYTAGRMRVRHVHELVLTSFVGAKPVEAGVIYEARHADGNKDNNRFNNLSWAPQTVNAQDRVDHGTCNLLAKGTDHPQGKLSDEQIKEIIAMPGTHKEIAAKYGISRGYVGEIKKRGGRDPRRKGVDRG
jgi:hypothetical protein